MTDNDATDAGSTPQRVERATWSTSGAGRPRTRCDDESGTPPTEMLAAGVDPVTVAGHAGHENPAVTLKTYAAFVPAKDKAAAYLSCV